MKKTIIALLALCGTSMGATLTTANLVSTINTSLTEQNYKAGDSFDITFSLESVWSGANYAGILGLGTTFNEVTKDDQLRLETTASGLSSAIIGVAVDGDSIGSNVADFWTTGTRSWNGETSTAVATLETPGSAWMQFTETVSTTAALTNNTSNLQGAIITLSFDHTTSTSTVQVKNADNVTSILNYENTTWDATKIANTGWKNATWNENVTVSVTHAVPEPTTATLSLLALAGLAARRRRK